MTFKVKTVIKLSSALHRKVCLKCYLTILSITTMTLEHPVPTGQKTEWVSDSVRTLRRTQKSTWDWTSI